MNPVKLAGLTARPAEGTEHHAVGAAENTSAEPTLARFRRNTENPRKTSVNSAISSSLRSPRVGCFRPLSLLYLGDGLGDELAMPRKAAGLSAMKVRSAKPGRYGDGNGLYLFVRSPDARFWVFRSASRRPDTTDTANALDSAR